MTGKSKAQVHFHSERGAVQAARKAGPERTPASCKLNPKAALWAVGAPQAARYSGSAFNEESMRVSDRAQRACAR